MSDEEKLKMLRDYFGDDFFDNVIPYALSLGYCFEFEALCEEILKGNQ